MASRALSTPRHNKPDAGEMARVLLESPEPNVEDLTPYIKGQKTTLTGHRTLSAPGACDACDDGWAQLEEDARFGDNYQRALKAKSRIHLYINKHPNCTTSELEEQFACSDATLRICLHLLVDRYAVQGVDPYACGCPGKHNSIYRTIHFPSL